MTFFADILPASLAAASAASLPSTAAMGSVAGLSAATAAGTTSGLSLASLIGMGSGALQLITGIGGAFQQSGNLEAQAKFAQMVAQKEAAAQREEDRFLAARARVQNFRGIVRTSGSPLLDDMENARRIRQRYQDRIFQGRVSAFEARSRIPGAFLSGLSDASQGGLSIATELYRSLLPTA